MADIELVIKIPEMVYDSILEEHDGWNNLVCTAIRNGSPLPKGHGRLVDLEQMCEDYWDGNYMEINFENLKSIKTIIEANKAESEEEQ